MGTHQHLCQDELGVIKLFRLRRCGLYHELPSTASILSMLMIRGI